MQWTGRVVTDTRRDLEDWILDYYDIDDDEALAGAYEN